MWCEETPQHISVYYFMHVEREKADAECILGVIKYNTNILQFVVVCIPAKSSVH